MIISIDGPAGSGKSTVAECVAQKLGFIHFNSGSLYRGVCAFLVSKDTDFSKLNDFWKPPKMKLKTEYIDGTQHVFVNGKDFTNALRNNDVSINTPIISQIKGFRNMVDDCQRKFARSHNVVIDGRDIGSYVFPDADFKFYLDCDLHERAKRRLKEEKAKKNKITLKEIECQIAERDRIDINKKIAPLVIPQNAVIIDSTKLSIEQVVEKIVSTIK